MQKRNKIAKDLGSRKYHSKVVQSKKLYNRKKDKYKTYNAAAKMEE